MSAEAWDFLKVLVTLVVAPAVMWYLNRQQTEKIAQTQQAAAVEVKKEVAVAARKLEAKADVREAKLDRVEEKVNGNLEVRDARIRALEAKLRDHGIAE
jgi:hypothetical protein